ncbi:hypothetical protein N3930_09975, partial [Bacillus thuringiensis]|nr:hypothetical protein [Bacillus thuringiensis]
MAAPIKMIQKQELTEEEIKQQKLDDLKELLTNNEEALNQMFNIVGELNDIGMLEAAISSSTFISENKFTNFAPTSSSK